MLHDLLIAPKVRRTTDEDVCSQLNYRWLASIIFGMGLAITMAQYVGEPIHCWCLAEFTDAQCNYTQALCWIQTNFHIRQDQPMRADSELKGVSYYPWIPWMLFAACAVLNLPHIFWANSCSYSGLNLNKIIGEADLGGNLDHVASCIKFWLTHKSPSKHVDIADFFKGHLAAIGFFWLGRRSGSYLCGLIIFTKVLYLSISLILFVCLNMFIDGEFKAYGIEAAQYLFQGVPLNTSRFPKLTMCHIKVRQMQNILPVTLQCVLPINIYNEKIFIFLWLVLPFLIGMNAYSLFMWAGKLLAPAWRRSFVKNYVVIMSRCRQECEQTPLSLPAEGASNRSIFPSTLDSPPHESFDETDSSRGGRHDHQLRRRPKPDSRRARELEERRKKQEVDRITDDLLKVLGWDGIAVFYTLHNAIGVVGANQIFQKVYEQLKADGQL